MVVVTIVRTKEAVHMTGLGQLGLTIRSKEQHLDMKYTELGIVVKGTGPKKGTVGIIPLSNVIVVEVDAKASEME
jgi:hypothetical protein